jgi:PAS domain-containing protein
MAKRFSSKISNIDKSNRHLRTIVEKLCEVVTLYKLDSRLLFLSPTKAGGEVWLRTTLGNLTDGISIYDLEGRLLYCNQATLEVYGYFSVGDYRRAHIELHEVFWFSSGGRVWPAEEWPLQRILRGEKLIDLEICLHNKRNNWKKTFDCSGSVILDSNEQPQMAVMIIRNINTIQGNKKNPDAIGMKISPPDSK